MSISERLQMVIKMNGMSNASFADEIGVQRSSISHVIAGRNKPSIDFIQKILIRFPKVNADWLITGKRIGRTADDDGGIEEEESVESIQNKEGKIVEDEERPDYDSRQDKGEDSSESQFSGVDSKRRKTIQKIVVFYTDGTFEMSLPS